MTLCAKYSGEGRIVISDKCFVYQFNFRFPNPVKWIWRWAGRSPAHLQIVYPGRGGNPCRRDGFESAGRRGEEPQTVLVNQVLSRQDIRQGNL